MVENGRSILVVEDSEEDFVALKRAFDSAGMRNPIYHCEDGDDALDFLFRRGEFASPEVSPRPSVILLDLNLPGTDGREVLAEIKRDANLCKIPVIVFTTSTDPRDIEACYAAGANTYIQKPVDMAGFIEAVGRLKQFWFEVAILPARSGDAP